MLCRNCGMEIPDGSNFCPNCGAKTAQPVNSQPQGQQTWQGQPKHAGQASASAPKPGIPGKLLKIGIVVVAAVVVIGVASTVMNVIGDSQDTGPAGNHGKTGKEQVVLPDPSGVIALKDFDWCFKSRNYDSSKDVTLSSPYMPDGAWKVTIMRKPTKKAKTRMELYLMDVAIEGRPKNIGSEDGAADVYGNQAFKKSDEAKEAGLQGSNTAENLLNALAEGDGTLPAKATLVLLLVEDDNGNMVQPKQAVYTDLTGIYHPGLTYLRLEDANGNRYSSNVFVQNGKEEHTTGAFLTSKDDQSLNGIMAMCRDIN